MSGMLRGDVVGTCADGRMEKRYHDEDQNG